MNRCRIAYQSRHCYSVADYMLEGLGVLGGSPPVEIAGLLRRGSLQASVTGSSYLHLTEGGLTAFGHQETATAHRIKVPLLSEVLCRQSQKRHRRRRRQHDRPVGARLEQLAVEDHARMVALDADFVAALQMHAGNAASPQASADRREIGRASCRERVCQYV